MPKWEAIELMLTGEDRSALEAAAKRAGQSLPVYIKNAALAVAHDTVKQRNRHELMWIFREAASRGHIWTEAELKTEGLPLYWSETWVRERLAEGCTISQIAVLCHSPKTTVANHLNAHFNLGSGRKTLSATDVQTIRERIQKGDTRQAIAQDYQISKSALTQHLRDQPSTHEVESLEAIQRVQPELGLPPIDADTPWYERLLLQQLAAVDPWPANVTQISHQLFDGNQHVARTWVSKQFRAGRLVRVRYGVYDLNANASAVHHKK